MLSYCMCRSCVLVALLAILHQANLLPYSKPSPPFYCCQHPILCTGSHYYIANLLPFQSLHSFGPIYIYILIYWETLSLIYSLFPRHNHWKSIIIGDQVILSVSMGFWSIHKTSSLDLWMKNFPNSSLGCLHVPNVLYNFNQFITLARFSKNWASNHWLEGQNPGSNLIFWCLCWRID